MNEQAVAWINQELDPNLSPRQRDRVRVAQHAFEHRLWHLCSRMPTRLPHT